MKVLNRSAFNEALSHFSDDVKEFNKRSILAIDTDDLSTPKGCLRALIKFMFYFTLLISAFIGGISLLMLFITGIGYLASNPHAVNASVANMLFTILAIAVFHIWSQSYFVRMRKADDAIWVRHRDSLTQALCNSQDPSDDRIKSLLLKREESIYTRFLRCPESWFVEFIFAESDTCVDNYSLLSEIREARKEMSSNTQEKSFESKIARLRKKYTQSEKTDIEPMQSYKDFKEVELQKLSIFSEIAIKQQVGVNLTLGITTLFLFVSCLKHGLDFVALSFLGIMIAGILMLAAWSEEEIRKITRKFIQSNKNSILHLVLSSDVRLSICQFNTLIDIARDKPVYENRLLPAIKALKESNQSHLVELPLGELYDATFCVCDKKPKQG